MKQVIYGMALVLTFFLISACDQKSNTKSTEDHSETAMIESQLSRLKVDLQTLRKEIANAPEPEYDPEKLAAMTEEERLAMQDIQISYMVKKQMLAQQAMSMIEEVNIEKNNAIEHKEIETVKELDALLSSILEFQKELDPVQENTSHME